MKRINLTISDDVASQLDELAAVLGLKKSAAISFCIAQFHDLYVENIDHLERLKKSNKEVN